MVPPYDDANIVLGQSTCAYEILERAPEVGTFLAPIGGGGLLAGTCATAAAFAPGATRGRRRAGRSGQAERRARGRAAHAARTDRQHRRRAAAACRSGQLTFEYIRPVRARGGRRSRDEEIGRAVKYLYHEQGLRVEPSGAVGVAALLAGKLRPTHPTAVILSGGNVDPALFAQLVA